MSGAKIKYYTLEVQWEAPFQQNATRILKGCRTLPWANCPSCSTLMEPCFKRQVRRLADESEGPMNVKPEATTNDPFYRALIYTCSICRSGQTNQGQSFCTLADFFSTLDKNSKVNNLSTFMDELEKGSLSTVHVRNMVSRNRNASTPKSELPQQPAAAPSARSAPPQSTAPHPSAQLPRLAAAPPPLCRKNLRARLRLTPEDILKSVFI